MGDLFVDSSHLLADESNFVVFLFQLHVTNAEGLSLGVKSLVLILLSGKVVDVFLQVLDHLVELISQFIVAGVGRAQQLPYVMPLTVSLPHPY